jgi:hypothetical protein
LPLRFAFSIVVLTILREQLLKPRQWAFKWYFLAYLLLQT